jgi:hypothetical protein
VGDEGYVDVFIGPCVKKANFTTADAFLAWGGKDDDLPGEIVALNCGGGRESCSYGGYGDEIVATCVA